MELATCKSYECGAKRVTVSLLHCESTDESAGTVGTVDASDHITSGYERSVPKFDFETHSCVTEVSGAEFVERSATEDLFPGTEVGKCLGVCASVSCLYEGANSD